jgi:hypothetical protein
VHPLAGPPARGAEAGSDEENDPGAAAERHGGDGHFCEHGALACHGLPRIRVTNSQKSSIIETLYSKYSRALTSENLGQVLLSPSRPARLHGLNGHRGLPEHCGAGGRDFLRL